MATKNIEELVQQIISKELEFRKYKQLWEENHRIRDEQYNSFCDLMKEKAKEIGFNVKFSKGFTEMYDDEGLMIKPPLFDFIPLDQE
jgi:predicted metallo-beta-lactamase superfamily hydrolase